MIDDQSVIDYVRFWLGNLPESVISDEDMLQIIGIVRLQYPDATDCQLLFYTTVAVLEWLIRQDSQGSSGTVGSGEVKSRSEQRGTTKIVQEWDVGTSGGTQGSWGSILEDLKSDPNSIGCVVYPSASADEIGSVIIGVTKDRFETSAPWRQNLLTPKRKSWYDTK